MEFGPKTKKVLAVLGPELIIAPVAAIGAVYCAHKNPDQLNKYKEFLCKHVVEPHLKLFLPYEKAIDKAREKYDQEQHEERIRRGEPAEEVAKKQRTDHERAEIISDVLAKGSIAFGADIVATYAGQLVLNSILRAEIPAAKTTFIEAAVHLGLVATLPRLIPGLMEDIHFGLAKFVGNTFHLNKHAADERAVPYTYIALPGQIASLASLAFVLNKKHGGASPARG
jgi:hypothetical protein